MHHEAGVRVVTVGGRPVPGPMQGVGNTRGARLMPTSILDNNIEVTQEILGPSPDANFLPNRTEALDVFVLDGGVNLRDQVRQGETTPLQFVYEAADCRIYYTPQTILNYTALWTFAANAMSTDPPLCVAGSTGILPSDSTSSQSSPLESFDPTKYIPNNENATPLVDPGEITEELSGDLTDQKHTRLQVTFIDCPVLNTGCCYPGFACPDPGLICAPIQRFASDSRFFPTCVPRCNGGEGRPCGGGTCHITGYSENANLFLIPTGFCKLFPVEDEAVGVGGTRALLS